MGDPKRHSVPVPEGYRAATEDAAVLPRPDRRFLRVWGRAPGQMLLGLLTSRLPREEEEVAEGVSRGEAVPSAVLTPKGKILSDLRVLREGEEGFLLDLPSAGFENVRAHFARYLPPRMARAEERTGETALLTLVGPRGRTLLEGVLPELEDGRLDALDEEGDLLSAETRRLGRLRVIRSGELAAEALDLLVPEASARTLVRELKAAGAEDATPDALRVLRMEKGRPAFGVDMDPEILLVEAGIHPLVLDDAKGCFTGQEVVVRIRDRGRVNRHLRWIFLGDAPLPEAGTRLFQPGAGKDVGWVTGACVSPRFGETLALGYVRRSVEPGEAVRVGEPGGPEGVVGEPGGEVS